jgi:hypothetical protein
MHTGWVRRLAIGVVLGAAGLVFTVPGVAMAGGGASGSVEPSVVEPGDNANFFIECADASTSASLTGTAIGLPSNIDMDKLTSREFDVDLTVPKSVHRGTYHLSMQCSDGSFTEVSLVISPHGGADTGDGATAGGASTAALAAGSALIIGAVGGGVLLIRRRGATAGRC